jgi:putative Mg2+ transporter-C (MgtC) family protein
VSSDLAGIELWRDPGYIALSAFLGGAIGIERRLKARSAGMRTQMIISASCCVAMLVSRYMPRLFPGSDPGHLAQSVLQGIGFLGAGAILKTGLSVHGLTTAASIWVAATLGLCVGAGLLIHAVALAVLATAGLVLLEPLENLLTRRRELRRIVIESSDAPGLVEKVEAAFRNHRVVHDELGITRNLDRHRIILTVVASCPEELSEEALAGELSRLPGVAEVRVE